MGAHVAPRVPEGAGNEQIKVMVIRAENQDHDRAEQEHMNHMTSKHFRIIQAFNRQWTVFVRYPSAISPAASPLIIFHLYILCYSWLANSAGMLVCWEETCLPS